MKITANAVVWLVMAGAVLASAGCAPPFSPELLDQIDSSLAFAALFKDPDRAAGRMVLLGGTIVEIRNEKAGTQIEVLQKDLDGEGRPELSDRTGGRFLVSTAQFLDPALYQRGRSVTVVGLVQGPMVMKLGGVDYRYPVIAAQELHLWSPHAGPRFSIGIGVYRGF